MRIRVKKTNLEQKLLDYELVETGLEEKAADAGPDEGMAPSGSGGQAGKSGKGKDRKGFRSSGKKYSSKGSRKRGGKPKRDQ